MIKRYRGHTIEAVREDRYDGDEFIFYAIVRDKDDYIVDDGVLSPTNTVREVIDGLTKQVDEVIAENEAYI